MEKQLPHINYNLSNLFFIVSISNVYNNLQFKKKKNTNNTLTDYTLPGKRTEKSLINK